MKQLQQNTAKDKSIFLCLIFSLPLLFPSTAQGITKRWVDNIMGNVFIQKEGKLSLIGNKTKIPDLVHLTTEENSSIVFGDSFDHKYQMPGKSLIQILNKIVELKRGHLRIISTNDRQFFQIQTANSVIQFKKVDAIISYDVIEGKTQVMVLYGNLRLSNILTPKNYINIESGTFSFIDNSTNEGHPRKATAIGKESFRKMMAIFNEKIPSTSPPKPTIRTIAGIKNNYAPKKGNQKAGTIYFISSSKSAKDSTKFELSNFYKEKMSDIKRKKEARKIPLFKRRTGVSLFIIDGEENRQKKKKRKLASHHKRKSKKRKKALKSKKSSKPSRSKGTIGKFEKTLDAQYVKQLRHSNEVNGLIDELKSFKKDYNKNH